MYLRGSGNGTTSARRPVLEHEARRPAASDVVAGPRHAAQRPRRPSGSRPRAASTTRFTRPSPAREPLRPSPTRARDDLPRKTRAGTAGSVVRPACNKDYAQLQDDAAHVEEGRRHRLCSFDTDCTCVTLVCMLPEAQACATLAIREAPSPPDAPSSTKSPRSPSFLGNTRPRSSPATRELLDLRPNAMAMNGDMDRRRTDDDSQNHVVFAWRRPTPPFYIGGAEISRALLAEELVCAGWKVTCLGSYEHPRGLPPFGAFALELAVGTLVQQGTTPSVDRATLKYTYRGITCLATSQSGLAETFSMLIARGAHRVVLAQEGAAALALYAKACGIPVVGVLHSVSATGLEVLTASPEYAIAQSRFVASRCPPNSTTRVVLAHAVFRVPTNAARFLPSRASFLLVNPVPPKGSAILREVALALPARRFVAIETWSAADPDLADIPNVEIVPRQWNLASYYNAARVLLVPSIVDDAFPRVVTEAGFHGVPSLGSTRGGVPEAIGDGGVVLPLDSRAWVDALRELDDNDRLQSLSCKALAQAHDRVRPVAHLLRCEGVL